MSEFEKTRLEWMIYHDHSLTEMIQILQEMQNESRENMMDEPTVKDLFDVFEYEVGFNSEIWPSKED